MWGYGERRIPIMMCNVELLAWTSISCKLNIGIPTILRHGMETTSRKKQNFRHDETGMCGLGRVE